MQICCHGVSARHSEKSAIPKAVIQGLQGIVLDIVSYYLALQLLNSKMRYFTMKM